MAGVITQETAQSLRAALDEVLRSSPDVPATARSAFARLVDVLETHSDAAVFPADSTVSTQQAGDLLGVSRMTVVRLVDKGELAAEGAVHRRIPVPELARYQAKTSQRRRAAIADLADDLDEDTPPDEVIQTR
jgi:excisionase family DNA binding protein